jgi:hypothetical protein
MDTVVRKPFQGVVNIIRFNWHFYAIAGMLFILLSIVTIQINSPLTWLTTIAVLLIICSACISLLVSYYVYDYSGMYNLEWLKEFSPAKNARMVNIHAGFDETSTILAKTFPGTALQVFDFYDPEKHTEVSIERARKIYAPYPGTMKINTTNIPVEGNSIDLLFNIFALHEIRNRQERIAFLRNQYSILGDEGRCIVVEHLRGVPNFLAYNVGFFHFFSMNEWKSNFSEAGFGVERTKKVTPFITVFILKKRNGDTP